MTENEVRTLVERRRDAMGRPRPSKEEREQIVSYLRSQRAKGLGVEELSKRTGLSDKTVTKYLADSGKATKRKFRRLDVAFPSLFVIEGAAGLCVRCADATSAAAVLVAAAKAS